MVPRLGEYSLRGDVVFRRGRQPTCRDSSERDQEQTPQPLSSHPTSYPTGSPLDKGVCACSSSRSATPCTGPCEGGVRTRLEGQMGTTYLAQNFMISLNPGNSVK